jgi:hypothetical protein
MFKNKKFDYMLGSGSLLAGYDMFGMLSQMEEHNKQRKREEKGITKIEGYEGIEQLKIPHIYDLIEIKDDYFYCYDHSEEPSKRSKILTVYNEDGKLLFSGISADYYKEGMFLVKDKSENSTKTDDFCALYNEDVQLTDYIFHARGLYSEFNKHGFLIVSLKDSLKSCVINKNGEVLYTQEGYESIYLHGVFCSTNKGYLNLLNGDIVCEKEYGSTLETKEFKFIKVDLNCVYQLNINTGECIIHGEKEEPTIKEVKKTPEEIEEEKIRKEARQKEIEEKNKFKKLGRNDICACGSGKKFKNCCIDKY